MDKTEPGAVGPAGFVNVHVLEHHIVSVQGDDVEGIRDRK